MDRWYRIKLVLIFVGIVMVAALVNAAREADVTTVIMCGVFGAISLGGAGLVHRYR